MHCAAQALRLSHGRARMLSWSPCSPRRHWVLLGRQLPAAGPVLCPRPGEGRRGCSQRAPPAGAGTGGESADPSAQQPGPLGKRGSRQVPLHGARNHADLAGALQGRTPVPAAAVCPVPSPALPTAGAQETPFGTGSPLYTSYFSSTPPTPPAPHEGRRGARQPWAPAQPLAHGKRWRHGCRLVQGIPGPEARWAVSGVGNGSQGTREHRDWGGGT